MKTEAEIEAANTYHSFMRGWAAGAGGNAMDPRFTAKPEGDALRAAYEQGYASGRVARAGASKQASKSSGYTPSILRTQDVEADV